MSEYRRKGGTAEWHWRESCPNWPDRDFERRRDKPPGVPFCKRCEEIDRS